MSARVGRQPAPSAPWLFGPWFQTGHANEQPREGEFVETLRRADAPSSAAETHLRYLPCEASLGREAAERARSAALHAQGAAALTYLNNELCADTSLFAEGAAVGAFQRRADGSPYVFDAYVGGRGATPIAQFDFSAPAGVRLWQSVVDRTAADGFDGFMEDYGEYTPPDSVSANGMTGLEMHNLYPVLYHRVDTLADYGTRPGLVKLADRRDELVLLTFPRGASRGRFDADGRWRSVEGRRSWTMRLDAERTRDVRLQASLGALARGGWRPCSVRVGGRALPRSAWSYAPRAKALTARFAAARHTTVRVTAC